MSLPALTAGAHAESKPPPGEATYGCGQPLEGPDPRWSWLLAFAGLASLYGPTLWGLFHGVWVSDSQGHGPIVFAVVIWLFARSAPQIGQLPVQPAPTPGWTLFALGLLMYVIGRSQDILLLEVGSSILVVLALQLLFVGPALPKLMWFPIFFMLFMVPLPSAIVDAVTQPMKMAVSYCADIVMSSVGYPISRTGVILYVGQYQLLVADACAGLHTLFTLEAVGLLYMNLIRHESVLRNVLLAILIVPISFTANVIRVIVLCLVTYHLGDEAGQGFLHGFAGMVLFMAALMLIIGTDSLLRVAARWHASRSGAPS
ncbi:exosortase B [Sphaerotilus microaerophilus]|uniref:Exosortase n=1 Tax=Sphaerotilus microaerophilus TaxID=2914710 RepID=A0ABM7YKQ2_9BURK|nr:exosortase B [Sphaerotilus sp. FB-5]BDI04947.1 exosortase [Sphaerotilus sp. FB-5]